MSHAGIIAVRAVAAAALSLGASAMRVGAQGGQTPALQPGECYGFSFGPWDPPLDRSASGAPAVHTAPEAAAGRPHEWAVPGSTPGGSSLILFPSWWPNGVGLRFTERSPSGDTLRGVATAFVADGSLRRPTSTIRAWRIPCGGQPSGGKSDSSRGKLSPPGAAPPAS